MPKIGTGIRIYPQLNMCSFSSESVSDCWKKQVSFFCSFAQFAGISNETKYTWIFTDNVLCLNQPSLIDPFICANMQHVYTWIKCEWHSTGSAWKNEVTRFFNWLILFLLEIKCVHRPWFWMNTDLCWWLQSQVFEHCTVRVVAFFRMVADFRIYLPGYP